MADTPALPEVVVFDVNETLSDMSAVRARFSDVGATEQLAGLWFATLLRDAFALTAAGTSERFAVIADGMLRTLLAGVELDRDVDDAVQHVMSGFRARRAPRRPGGAALMRAAGARLVTLTNGGASVAEGLLTRAGVGDQFEALLSVEDPGLWKPAPGSYRYAASRCGTDIAAMMLVAVHPLTATAPRGPGCARRGSTGPGRPIPRTSPRPMSRRPRWRTWAVHGAPRAAPTRVTSAAKWKQGTASPGSCTT